VQASQPEQDGEGAAGQRGPARGLAHDMADAGFGSQEQREALNLMGLHAEALASRIMDLRKSSSAWKLTLKDWLRGEALSGTELAYRLRHWFLVWTWNTAVKTSSQDPLRMPSVGQATPSHCRPFSERRLHSPTPPPLVAGVHSVLCAVGRPWGGSGRDPAVRAGVQPGLVPHRSLNGTGPKAQLLC
jgi:hypothetical protein